MQQILLTLLLIINVLSFLLIGLDKLKACYGWWRVSETTLLFLAAFFGAAGILGGMIIFRHKIRKPLFYMGVPMLLAFNLTSLYYLFALN